MPLDYDVIDRASGEVLISVRHLWHDEPMDCCMCGKPHYGTRYVPYHCGPTLERHCQGGYKTACDECHDIWAAWADKTERRTTTQEQDK